MADEVAYALLDTSILIADADRLGLEANQSAAISVITLGELRAGVLLASRATVRAARQARLAAINAAFRPLPVDETVAEAYGDVLAAARSQQRMSKATDLLIIATARSTGRILYTLDHAQAQLAEAVGVPSRSEIVHIRDGRTTDDRTLLDMWDRAIAWLVARGQAMQWGTEPASQQPRFREYVRQWVRDPGLRIAELDGRPVGASVIVETPPAHIPPTSLRETYLLFLISDRDQAGKGIGSALVRRAVTDARGAGSEVLRVDCWAEAPDLVAWYERQGFVRSDSFTVDLRGGWHGQVFEMKL